MPYKIRKQNWKWRMKSVLWWWYIYTLLWNDQDFIIMSPIGSFTHKAHFSTSRALWCWLSTLVWFCLLEYYCGNYSTYSNFKHHDPRSGTITDSLVLNRVIDFLTCTSNFSICFARLISNSVSSFLSTLRGLNRIYLTYLYLKKTIYQNALFTQPNS